MNDWTHWIKGLGAAAIGGAATAGGSWLGLATARGLGADVHVLNWKELGIVLVIGGLSTAFAYLQQSPLPTTTTTTQVTITKEVTEKSDVI